MKTNRFLTYASAMFLLGAVTVGCSEEQDLYDPSYAGESESTEVNTFDFSTVNEITLNVNYNLGEIPFNVGFEVYAENPFNESVSEDGVVTYTMKEDVNPVYWDYTDNKGKFSKSGIKVPAYAKTLYIVSGNPFATQIMEATVNGNTVTATASAAIASAAAKGTKAATTKLPASLSYNSDTSGNIRENEQICKGWYSWLGTFDDKSGRPNYILDRATADSRLIFTNEELAGLYDAVGNSVDRNKTCPDYLRQHGDMTLERDSEIAITLLGGNTCWNSTLGYFTYTGEAPKDLKEVNIVCILPNTQDGKWNARQNPDFRAIGIERGEAVQLMYYPNLAEGSAEGATTIFPAGTKIGFVLKNNGWGGQGKSYATDNYRNTNNHWSCSTDGLSQNNAQNKPNGLQMDDHSARTAAFQFTTGANTYAILAFEDYVDDQNFSDVTFSLKPASAFQPLPEVVDEEVNTTQGVYAYEDLWPAKGDYDMNDVVVNYRYSNNLVKYNNDTEYKMASESVAFQTFQNYAAYDNGLAVKLMDKDLNANAEVSMWMRTSTDVPFEAASFNSYQDTDGNTVYRLTDNVKTNMGAQYMLTLNYYIDEEGHGGKGTTNQIEVQPFIYRNDMEVHIPYEAPTSKANLSYFGTEDDMSDPDQGLWYVRSGNYPFAFYLMNATQNDIAPLLNRANESKPINELYPKFLEWSTSNGASAQDWYKIGQ